MFFYHTKLIFCSHLPSVTIFSILGHLLSSGCIIVSLVFFCHTKLIFCSHLQSVTIFSILGHSWPFLAVLVSSGFIIVSLMFFYLTKLIFRSHLQSVTIFSILSHSCFFWVSHCLLGVFLSYQTHILKSFTICDNLLHP